MARVRLPNPDECRCGGAGVVVQTRRRTGFKYRTRRCESCGRTWPTWETVVNPRRLRREPAVQSKNTRSS